MTPDEARVILISKLKGRKDKGISLLKIAKAVQILKDSESKSSIQLGREYDISKSIIDDFYNMNKHSDEIKKLIQKKMIGLDTSTKLFKIKDKKIRDEFAKEIAGLPAMDCRYIIDYHRRDPTLSAKECKKLVLKSKTNMTEMHLVVTPLEDTDFQKLQKYARAKKLPINDVARNAIVQYLRGEK